MRSLCHLLAIHCLTHTMGTLPAGRTISTSTGSSLTPAATAKPFIEVQWQMLHHNPSILYFKQLMLVVQVCAPQRPTSGMPQHPLASFWQTWNSLVSMHVLSEDRWRMQTRLLVWAR